jgi:hypothetical protein
MIPLAPYVTVDRVARRVVVDAPPGLLDEVEPERGGPQPERDEP